MTSHDLHSNIKVVQHLAAAAYTSTQTPSDGVDTQGFESLEFLIAVGAIANIAQSPTPYWTFKLQESDSQSSGFTDVTDANSVIYGSAKSPATSPNSSTGVFLTVDHADEDALTYRIGYRGGKRYTRVVSTATETPGSTPLCILAVLSHAAYRPTAD